MKLSKWKVMLTLLFALGLFLAACGSGDETTEDQDVEETENDGASESDESAYQPEEINPEVDVCEVCAMAVGDDQFATQIVLQDNRVLKFDDIGCMYSWLDENGEEEVGEKFVRDYESQEWTVMDNATYVFDEDIQTPMAYGVISFNEEADAESFVEEHGSGDILNVGQLSDEHQWEMMDHGHDHDMDHHDNGDDEEHDHEA